MAQDDDGLGLVGLVLFGIGVAWLFDFWPFDSANRKCREYSDFTCSQIQEADYNVFFYTPSQNERYLGYARGLDACGGVAHAYASQEQYSGRNWGYVCCMIANGSQCQEKHR